MKYCILFIPLGIFLLSINTSLAAETDIDGLKTQQRQLQLLLSEVEKASQQRAQHNAQIKRLKHQLECNWTLIRSYESCGRLHADDTKEHLNCLTAAKRTATTCLESAQAK
jgi:hypothetical protein